MCSSNWTGLFFQRVAPSHKQRDMDGWWKIHALKSDWNEYGLDNDGWCIQRNNDMYVIKIAHMIVVVVNFRLYMNTHKKRKEMRSLISANRNVIAESVILWWNNWNLHLMTVFDWNYFLSIYVLYFKNISDIW